MHSRDRKKALLAIFIVLVLASLACLGGGNNNGGGDTGGDTGGNTGGNTDPGPDLAATAASLAATQAAIDAAAAAPTATTATDSGGDGGGDTGGPIDPSQFNSGDIMFQSEFEFAGDWEPGWLHFSILEENDNYTARMEGGYLYIEVIETNTTVYAIQEDLYMERGEADVFVGTGFDNVGSVRNNNISVMCRVTDDGWYEFSFASSGLWYIYKYTNVGGDLSDQNYKILANGGVPGYNKNETAHEISATCIENTLTFYFDGVELKNGEFTDSDAPFREGTVGVSVFAANLSGVAVEFDWFEVQKP